MVDYSFAKLIYEGRAQTTAAPNVMRKDFGDTHR